MGIKLPRKSASKKRNFSHKRSFKLYNLILPILLWEVWKVLLSLLIVASIEAAILNFCLGIKKFNFFKVSFLMNLATTLFGYVLQGIFRFVFLSIGIELIPADSPIIQGITGNIGIGYPFPLETFTSNFITSCILAFSISVLVEYFILQNLTDGKVKKKRVFWVVFLANFVTYSIIFLWILFNFFAFYLDGVST